MHKNNFLISGFGRSGSKFLSNIMNKSEEWTVEHEPRFSRDEKLKDSVGYHTLVEKDFIDYYGEVNTYMRFHIEKMRVQRKGLLLRDPLDVFLSVANRKYQNTHLVYISEIEYWYNQFFRLIDSNENIKPISFVKMTSDLDYLDDVIKHFGIMDVNISEDVIKKKVNPNRSIRYKTIQDLPTNITNKAISKLSKFNKRIELI